MITTTTTAPSVSARSGAAATPISIRSRSFDHRTHSTHGGGPASSFRRVERARRTAPGAPNYTARRVGAVLAALVAVVAAASVIDAVLVSFGGNPAFAVEAEPAAASAQPVEDTVHVARAGESLWTIADAHRGDISRDAYMRRLIELNGSTVIIVGQAVPLP